MILSEKHWRDLESKKHRTALLPWGATEPHNRHLPYGTDSLCSERIARLVSERCEERGFETAVLPGISYGVNTGQRDLNLCISIRPSVQYALLREIATAIEGHSIENLIIINGHGGNNFKPLLRELSLDVPDLFASFINWWTVADAFQFFAEPGDHAGELETSVMLHLFPDLVLPLKDAGPGHERRFSVKGLAEGLAWAPRHWRSISSDTGVGNPGQATAAKGERFVNVCVKAIADFVCDLSDTPSNSLYEK